MAVEYTIEYILQSVLGTAKPVFNSKGKLIRQGGIAMNKLSNILEALNGIGVLSDNYEQVIDSIYCIIDSEDY